LQLNAWNHCAFVRESNTVSLYLNGARVFTTAFTGSVPNSTSAVSVGADASGSSPLQGYITNSRVVNGTALYSGTTYTVPTSPLTAIANTQLLTCQSNRFIDNSTNNFTITKVGDTLISPNIPFAQNSSYSTYGSTYFDGSTGYLSIPANNSFSTGTGDFTIEGWIYVTDLSTIRSICGTRTIADTTTGWNLAVLTTGSMQIWDNTPYAPTGTGSVVVNTWYHFAFVRQSNVLYSYINGIQKASTAVTRNWTQNTFWIGTNGGDLVNGTPFKGYISDTRFVNGTAVYTTSFTPPASPLTAIANTSLLTLQYNGGATNQAIIDNSNFNNIITRNGNTSQGTFSPYSVTGWSNYFDGTGDYLSPSSNTPMDFGTGNFTIEGWFLTGDKSISGGANRMIIGNSGNSYTMQLYIDSSGFLTFGNTTSTFIRGSTDLANNIWNHFAIVRSGTGSGQIKMYVNGIEVASGTNSITYVSGTIFIGAFGASDGFWNGYISNLRIIKGTALYTATFTPPTTPLTAIANTSLLTCQSNRFIDNSPNSFTLTRNGDVSVQAFSPFGSIPEAVPISYSNYFDGTGDYLSAGSNSSFAVGTGDFTFQAWVYPTAYTSPVAAIFDTGSSVASGRFSVVLYSSGLVYVDSNANLLISSSTLPLNTWTLISIIRSSGTMTMYFDGTSVASGSIANNFTETQSYIGRTIDSYYFNGYISNLRLVKGTALANTVPTSPLTAIANTSLLTCQSTRMIDNSTNAFTITAAGNTVPRQFNPFGYTAQTYTSYTPSLHSGSAYFDGTGDYLTALYNSNYNIPASTPFTVEGWAYTTATSEFHFVNRNWSYGSTGPTYAFYLASGTTPNWGIAGTGSATYVMMSPGTAGGLGRWNHYAWTRDVNNVCRIFTNGVEATGSTRTDSQALTSASGNMFIGVSTNLASNYTNGYLSDLRFVVGTCIYTSNFVPPTQTLGNYSTSVPSQLLLNFNNGGIIDQHSTNVLETVGNAQLSTAVKKYNNASMYFDGTGDNLKIPSSSNFQFGTGDFTIEMWLYITANPGAGDYAYIYAQGPNTTASMNLYIQGGVFRIWNGSAVIIGSTSYALNTWYHIAISRSGTSLRLFVNGVQDGSATNSSNITTGSTYGATIANWTEIADNRYFAGYIDDLRITKGYARYTTTFTPPTSAFIAK
jgi:hypothetical protein